MQFTADASRKLKKSKLLKFVDVFVLTNVVFWGNFLIFFIACKKIILVDNLDNVSLTVFSPHDVNNSDALTNFINIEFVHNLENDKLLF